MSIIWYTYNDSLTNIPLFRWKVSRFVFKLQVWWLGCNMDTIQDIGIYTIHHILAKFQVNLRK